MAYAPRGPHEKDQTQAVRLTYQALRVLNAFLLAFSDNVRAELAGADVMRATRLTAGTVYPLLLRLERAGILTSRWENLRPEEISRPRRRLYTLTSDGAVQARNALSEVSFALRPAPEKA